MRYGSSDNFAMELKERVSPRKFRGVFFGFFEYPSVYVHIYKKNKFIINITKARKGEGAVYYKHQ